MTWFTGKSGKPTSCLVWSFCASEQGYEVLENNEDSYLYHSVAFPEDPRDPRVFFLYKDGTSYSIAVYDTMSCQSIDDLVDLYGKMDTRFTVMFPDGDGGVSCLGDFEENNSYNPDDLGPPMVAHKVMTTEERAKFVFEYFEDGNFEDLSEEVKARLAVIDPNRIPYVTIEMYEAFRK